MNRIKAPEKVVIPNHNTCLNEQTGSALIGSMSTRKKKNTFLTQRKLSPEQMVLESHNQLIQYINQLEVKVHKIIETHDSKFLLAYRSHLNRVREQMEELKNKNAKNANSASNHTQKIQNLQKELCIFREQALKLFQKLTQKDKTLQLMNMKVYELQTEQKFNKNTISSLMKRNKYLQGLLKQFNTNKDIDGNLKLETIQKKSASFFDCNSLRKYSSQQRRSTNKVEKEKYKRLSVFISQNDSEHDSKHTTTALRSKRTTLVMNNTAYNPKQILQNYFIDNAASKVKKF